MYLATIKPLFTRSHLANGGAHPWAVVIKTLDAVIIDATVVRAGRLVEVTRVIVSYHHAVVVDQHLDAPTATTVNKKGMVAEPVHVCRRHLAA